MTGGVTRFWVIIRFTRVGFITRVQQVSVVITWITVWSLGRVRIKGVVWVDIVERGRSVWMWCGRANLSKNVRGL